MGKQKNADNGKLFTNILLFICLSAVVFSMVMAFGENL